VGKGRSVRVLIFAQDRTTRIRSVVGGSHPGINERLVHIADDLSVSPLPARLTELRRSIRVEMSDVN